ncbi:type II secretion system protein [Luteolibacter pohnpeiensis]|uniref:Type II secretion system protein n=1 Tax=Luteolibacter pohnpeiensis TaxID=454153 RepID=A0A934VVY4_9BACT|nr:type II secretion system protein [Luteolibacter pohnpeiensis]MBK1884062.1 type II secretion system protein [Luteolibacter pohnpeiensis]
MKTPSSNRLRRTSGFTLIELLVVITIIMVLASAAFVVGSKAINKARKTVATAMATGIDSAVNRYYNEYSSIPDVGSSVSTDSPEGVRLLNILAGLDDGDDNPKKIKFLELKQAKGKLDGATMSDSGKYTGLYDPWGNPYTIFLDQDYEEKVTVKLGSMEKTLPSKRVATCTIGADKVAGTPDDVKSWN